ncbi:unnamed protein product (macronuclear) [Paramecium tetraurelia]|uniref:Major facilitator superfamily (MFS) profile domain-containing protein n=1 Tax=Paramecium tetraurelia TaxID=5888 RepID=A0CQ35_PARTE|nr:uncharacterized protein GSPATT00009250001 [Paramecium tetraurelia]CAK72902.1 unnamed protein product [Paramecium tetraurelia]|eukprot:XP_001440299.1 hypothetical protein (macronuclear) [Paramecium tetraurelia strain d4-2]
MQLVVIMIGMVYYHDELFPISETLLKQFALVGTLIGQLLFGYLADLL